MTEFGFVRALGAVCAAAVLTAPSAAASEPAAAQPVVVELFTSQGCGMCPAANKRLGALSEQDGVIALAFSVDHWDYLGWRDRFARPEFVARQAAYGGQLDTTPYTPQVVVNGRTDVRGGRWRRVENAVEAAGAAEAPAAGTPALAVSRTADGAAEIHVGAAAGPTGALFEDALQTAGRAPADIWLVAYSLEMIEADITGGDNRGKRMEHHNLVTRLERVGGWTGAAFEVTAEASPYSGLAVLVQESGGGPILAAAAAPPAVTPVAPGAAPLLANGPSDDG